MTQEGFKRKLTAILSADVEGYSRLMGEDEEATVRTITAYREVLITLIQQHNGKVLDSPGDNLLAEFASVVDAVQCAVAVQKEISARNDELPENRRMQFRIGINLGDVIQEEDRIYGDGVNIAARLEGLAEPGGICISKTAFDHIESKLPYGYEFLGEQEVKNIARPVGAYRVIMEPRVTAAGKPEEKKPTPVRIRVIVAGAAAVIVLAVAVGIWQFYMRGPSVEPAAVESMAYPLPDKPSIVVLPFVNMSGNPEDEYIADGITENIITSLSYLSGLFVISQNSAFFYKGQPVKIKQVGEDLGVQYVLEGSIQKSEDQIRVTAQLIDALSGYHVWAEQYDRKLKDFFKLQDEITQKIVVELNVNLADGERARLYLPNKSMEAWGYVIKADKLRKQMSEEGNYKAIELLKKSVELEPDYTLAWAMLSSSYYQNFRRGWTTSRREALAKANELLMKAFALDEDHPLVNIMLGGYYFDKGDYVKATAAQEKALGLSPNNADFHMRLSAIKCQSGEYDEAVALAERAMRLSPYPPAWFFGDLGRNYREAGRYDDAIKAYHQLLKRSRQGETDPLLPHLCLAVTYIYLDQETEAKNHANEVLKIWPNPSLNIIRKGLKFKDASRNSRFVDAFRKALTLAGWEAKE